MTAPVLLPNLLSLAAEALLAAEAVCEAARIRLRDMVSADGRIQNSLIEDHQTAAHGFAWLADRVLRPRSARFMTIVGFWGWATGCFWQPPSLSRFCHRSCSFSALDSWLWASPV